MQRKNDSPIFDIENLTCFADDKFPLAWNKCKKELVKIMEIKMGRIINWLVDSGMKVNEAKTELCLFHKGDTTPIKITINGNDVTSKKSINILGVIFDAKLQWSDHIAHTIKRSISALNAIRLIKKFFTKKELLGLVTSNFYSIMYYNAEIWHLPSLKTSLKQKLLSASAQALRVCCKTDVTMMSFMNIHSFCNRATPDQMMRYRLALSLYRLYNFEFNSVEFAILNFNQVFTSRQTKFKTNKNNRTKVGLNSLANRLHTINDQIPLDWLRLSMETFKIKCKSLFF